MKLFTLGPSNIFLAQKLIEQDGTSLESILYLNVTVRYIGPWDPWTLNLDTLGPWNLGMVWYGGYELLWGVMSLQMKRFQPYSAQKSFLGGG